MLKLCIHLSEPPKCSICLFFIVTVLLYLMDSFWYLYLSMIIEKRGYCSRNVLDHHKSIVCNHCKNWIHFKCSGISGLNASNSVKYAHWFCTKCLSSVLPFIQSDDLEISPLQRNYLNISLDNLSNKYVNPFSLNSSLKFK